MFTSNLGFKVQTLQSFKTPESFTKNYNLIFLFSKSMKTDFLQTVQDLGRGPQIAEGGEGNIQEFNNRRVSPAYRTSRDSRAAIRESDAGCCRAARRRV